jgi:thiamine transporter
MKNQKTLMLVEGAVMIALAAVLSLVKVYKLPWGGSITLLSMVPICLYSIKRGAAAGMAVSFVYSVVQLLLDLGEVLSWGLTAGTLVACFALDYILAYSVLGTAGIFRRFGTKGWIAGCVFALLLRLLMHFLSGVLIWHSVGKVWGFETSNEYLYSLLYNGSYMVPEMIFTTVAVVLLFRLTPIRKLLNSKN